MLKYFLTYNLHVTEKVMKKKYIVRLSAEERQQLTQLVHTGKVAAYRRTHAQILLWADEGEAGPGLLDEAVAARAGASASTVARVRQRCVEQGLEAALSRQVRSRERSRRLDGAGEAHLVALMCSDPPAGQARWTLQLLGAHLVALGVVESISHETVRKVLKKHHQTLAAEDVVHSAGPECGFRVCAGAGAGGVPAAVGPGLSAGVHG